MRTEQPWDWPPPRERQTLYFDGSIQRRKSSWWGSPTGRKVGRTVFRAGVSVAAAAVCIILTLVVFGGLGFLFILFRAAAR